METKTVADVTPAPAKLPRTTIKPLTVETSSVRVALRERTLEKFRRAREVMSGKSDDEIMAAALDLLLDLKAPERRHARRLKRAKTKAKAKAKASSKAKTDAETTTKLASEPNPKRESRMGRLADRDATAVEAGCQCEFVSAGGRRCEARAFMQTDHVISWALGGRSAKDNFQFLCARHNAYKAELEFGPWRI